MSKIFVLRHNDKVVFKSITPNRRVFSGAHPNITHMLSVVAMAEQDPS